MPKTSAQDLVDNIATTFSQLDDNFDQLFTACRTPKERQSLRDLHSAARDAFFGVIAHQLVDHNSVVLAINADLRKTNQKINGLLKGLKDIVAVLQAATEAVRLAGALAALAAA
jgi:hypothetical protein